MSDLASVLPATAQYRVKTVVAKASGSPITSGTVNHYLLALTGANAGKWWKAADNTWAASETATAMTHKADGNWSVQIATGAWADGVEYLEYVKESGDLHVPDGLHLVARYPAHTSDGTQFAGSSIDTIAGDVAGLDGAAMRGTDGAALATSLTTHDTAIKALLPSALVSGKIDASVGAYQTGQAPLQPTTAGRTLDVTATGEAGIDWSNIGAPTTTVVLSGTTIGTVTSPSAAVIADAVLEELVTDHSSVANSVAEALKIVRAMVLGKYTLSGTTFSIYAEDGVTVLKHFRVSNTERTPL